jgi:hypothetical protein
MSTQQPDYDLLIPEAFDPDKVHNVIPQLFIGLGGTGGRIVKRIYERMNSNPNWRKYQESSTGFLVLDTNIDDLDDFEENGKIEKICIKNPDQHERLTRAINSRDPHLEQWMPKDYRPRGKGFNLGAGQIRLESRVAHYINSDRIADRLDRMIGELTSSDNAYIAKDKNTVRVFVFLTLAGGTGSGCFLPMAYLTRERLEQRGLEPILTGYLMTSKTVKGHQAVKPEIWPQIDANSYAALKELEHFNGLASDVEPFEFPWRMPTASNDPIPFAKMPPFNWITLIDEPKRNTIGIKGIWKAVADMAYLNIASPSRANEDSARDNYTKFMRRRSKPLSGKGASLPNGFTMYWGTAGAAALVCPRQELLHYCSQRFIAQAIRQQFTLAADSVAESGLNLNKYEANVQRDLINKLWLKTFQELAADDMKRMKDEKAKLERGGVDPAEAERLAKMGMFYARRWHDVRGTWPGEGPTHTKKKASNVTRKKKGGGDATDKSAFQASALIPYIQEELDRRVNKLDTALVTTNQLRVASHQMQQGVIPGKLSDAKAKAQSAFKSMNDSVNHLTKDITSLFDGLRDARPGEENFEVDAITERYLVLEILENHAAGWLHNAKTQLEKVDGNTLLTPDNENPAWTTEATTLSADAVDRKVDTAKEWVVEKFTTANVDNDMDNFTTQYEELITGLVERTKAEARARIALSQMSAFVEFLKNRAKTYAEISQYAMERSDELDRTAAKMMLEELEDDKSYELSIEVLRDLENSVRRWDWFWEDDAQPVVKRLLADPKLLGNTISKAMKDEEDRVHREGLATSDPKQVLKACEESFGAIAQKTMAEFVRDNTSIDNLIELEAIYGKLSPTDMAERVQEISAGETNMSEAKARSLARSQILELWRTALVSPEHPQHRKVKDLLDDYVRAKLAALKAKAEPLSNFTKSTIDLKQDPMADLTIMVATERVLDRMEKNFGKALTTLNDTYQETGLQEWSDPRTLVLYHGIATTPIYAYEDIKGSLHGAYTTIQGRTHKESPLHIVGQWEDPAALPDLTIASRTRAELENWRDSNRTFLIDLMRVGLLRAERTEDKVQWQIKTDEWSWPGTDEKPALFHDERTADTLFSSLKTALSGPIRTNLQADIKSLPTKPRIGGQAAKAIEQLVRVGRADAWRDQGLIQDLEALSNGLRASLD